MDWIIIILLIANSILLITDWLRDRKSVKGEVMRSFKVVDAICSDKFLKGINADYSPKYYFKYNGAIYMKLKFEWHIYTTASTLK